MLVDAIEESIVKQAYAEADLKKAMLEDALAGIGILDQANVQACAEVTRNFVNAMRSVWFTEERAKLVERVAMTITAPSPTSLKDVADAIKPAKVSRGVRMRDDSLGF